MRNVLIAIGNLATRQADEAERLLYNSARWPRRGHMGIVALVPRSFSRWRRRRSARRLTASVREEWRLAS